MTNEKEPLVIRLYKRAYIRRNIKDRKSVQEGKPDKIANLLEEAAEYIEELEKAIFNYKWQIENNWRHNDRY